MTSTKPIYKPQTHQLAVDVHFDGAESYQHFVTGLGEINEDQTYEGLLKGGEVQFPRKTWGTHDSTTAYHERVTLVAALPKEMRGNQMQILDQQTAFGAEFDAFMEQHHVGTTSQTIQI